MRWPSAKLCVLLIEQHGLITRPQLLAAGLSPRAVDGRVYNGHLDRVHCGVYRLPGAPIPSEQAAMAAVLRCRPVAALSGELALALLDVEGCSMEATPLVLVGTNRTVCNVDFVVRGDGTWKPDRALVCDVPAVRATRALLDSCGGADDRLIVRRMDSMRWRGLASVERVALRAGDLPLHAGAARFLALHRRGLFEQESFGERSLARVLQGVEPQPRWGVWVAPDIKVDGLWADVRLVLEYYGKEHHSRERDRAHDHERVARLRALGYHVEVVVASDLDAPAALRARLLGVRAGMLAAQTRA
ncbi:MAG: type IV toxin-antitoxin system AbiEi family antitoxin domain-containing protein [Egibacteraceae bacterium]